MPVRLYLDVHVDKAIHDQLRLRACDVLRAQDDDAAEFSDDRLLGRATELGRLLFTQDVRFKALAEAWQRTGEQFSGLPFGNQLGATVGAYVKDLELIAKATDPAEWINVGAASALQIITGAMGGGVSRPSWLLPPLTPSPSPQKRWRGEFLSRVQVSSGVGRR